MRRPSPEILDLMYRAGAFPLDDLDVQEVVRHPTPVLASVWYIPTKTIPAIFFIMGGGSGDLSAMIYELRHLADCTEVLSLTKTHSESALKPVISYHYFFMVNHVDARVYSKTVEPMTAELLALMHASPLHPWFDPLAAHRDMYASGFVNSSNLPRLQYEYMDALEYLGDPERPIMPNPPSAAEPRDFPGSENIDIEGLPSLEELDLTEKDKELLGLKAQP